jgi:hypothetical protein
LTRRGESHPHEGDSWEGRIEAAKTLVPIVEAHLSVSMEILDSLIIHSAEDTSSAPSFHCCLPTAYLGPMGEGLFGATRSAQLTNDYISALWQEDIERYLGRSCLLSTELMEYTLFVDEKYVN